MNDVLRVVECHIMKEPIATSLSSNVEGYAIMASNEASGTQTRQITVIFESEKPILLGTKYEFQLSELVPYDPNLE